MYEVFCCILLLLFSAGGAGADDGRPAEPSNGVERGCRPLTGTEGLLVPGKVVVLGELHGTVQSPAFLLDLACHAVRSGLRLTVGLELSGAEQKNVDHYLDSDGRAADRNALIAGDIWQRDYQDGRNSRAMAELIDGLRVLRREGHPVTVVLFDVGGAGFRDARMAARLADAAEVEPDGLVLVLTGNLHSRVVGSGGSEHMAFLLSEAIGTDRVVSLDVAHVGGTSWLCFATSDGQQCGEVKLRPRGPEGDEDIVVSDAVGSNSHHGWYRIGEIEASPPAKTVFAVSPPDISTP